MGTREFQIDLSAALGIESLQGDALHAKLRDFARHEDSPKARESSTSGEGATRAPVHEPTLLDQYRKDPFGFRERVEREARRERARMVGAWLSQIFG